MFVVHDLAIAEYFCDRVAVLYLGRVMELAPSDVLFKRPLHPYTVGLLSAVPVPDPAQARRRRRVLLRGDAESAQAGMQTGGCPFRSRCPVGRDRSECADATPPLRPREDGHWVACHFPGEMQAETFEHDGGTPVGKAIGG
jgi:oligopeptide/dipeptide ABC transporter ATP-binding protein